MNRKIDYATRDKMIDEVLKKHRELDDICHKIFFYINGIQKAQIQ